MAVWTTPSKRRWVIWGILATAFLLMNLHRLSTAVLAEPLARTFDATAAELGTLHAAFFYIYAPLQLVAGVLSDRFGIRRTAAGGVAVMSVGALVFGFADTYALAFLGRLVIGLGGSVIYIATLRFCANWFRPDEFATMNGLTLSVSGIGGLLATTPLAIVVATAGWNATVQGLAVLGVAFAGAVYLLARDTPRAAGLDPIENVPSMPTLSLREVLVNARRVLSDTTTWFAGLILFTSAGVQLTVLGLWGIPYVVQTHGISVTNASTYALVGTVGLIVGTPAVGWISDRIGRRTTIIVAATVAHVAVFGTIAVLGTMPLTLVAVVFFFVGFIGGGFAITYTVIKDIHATAASGVATGTINAIGFSGAAVFPPVMGVILDAYWTGETVAGARVYTEVGYQVAFGIAALAGVTALLAALVLHVRTVREVSGAPDGAEERPSV